MVQEGSGSWKDMWQADVTLPFTRAANRLGLTIAGMSTYDPLAKRATPAWRAAVSALAERPQRDAGWCANRAGSAAGRRPQCAPGLARGADEGRLRVRSARPEDPSHMCVASDRRPPLRAPR